MVRVDPFLNLWDEQYHALVAKNLIHQPLKPVLIEQPLYGYIENYWSYCEVWMHKQPLFLWQMALSMKIFGCNELGVRFPSVVMNAAMVFFIFRLGKLFITPKVGFYSAFVYVFAYFPLEYLTGYYPTDHNDIAFMFYTFASIWALAEYYNSKRIVFLVLMGLFSGAAILCKWLTGLLVYAVWALLIFYNRQQQPIRKEALNFFSSLLICLLVFVPWQIFAYLHYPVEYVYEMNFNSKHLFEPLEGHGGTYRFYYDALSEEFGQGRFIKPSIILCFILLVYQIKNTNYKIITFFTTVIIYLFFTVAATKMIGYVFVIFPLFIIGITAAAQFVVAKLGSVAIPKIVLKTVFFLCLVLELYLVADFKKIYNNHHNSERNVYRTIKLKEKQFFKTLKDKLGNDKYLIFNCSIIDVNHITGIFYTGYPCISHMLSAEQIAYAQNLGYKIIVIDNGKVPERIRNDRSVMKVRY